jgi:hypothetical protein
MKNLIHLPGKYLYFTILFIGLLFSSNFISCNTMFAPDFVDKPVGNEVDIKLTNDSEYTDAELLFISKDTLYSLSMNSAVQLHHIKDVKQIKVNGYSDRSWIFAVLGMQVLPAIVLGVTAESAGSDGGFALSAVLLIPAVAEFILFEASTPKAPLYTKPLENKISSLRKYARYPYELQREQIDALINYYKVSGKNRVTVKQN